jgi:CPA1 family monovalent cation:H+ antiporter
MASISSDKCPHMPATTDTIMPASSACAECGATAPTRICLSCGHVGCCDSTRGHATLHARESEHAVFRSLPLSANSFTWCAVCNAYLN